MTKPIIGYRRVSTDKQGRSGLGLDAQDHALQNFATVSGGNVLRVYTEIESGTRNDRPELRKALAHALRSRAVLAVAVLDRLSRDSYYINKLLKSGVDFVDCQSPHDSPFITRIKAAVNQEERERISQRTKAALAAYKARGGKLGASRPECRNNLNDAGRKKGAIAAGLKQAEHAREAYADLLPQMIEWRELGATQQAIAERLNEQGHTTRHGCQWTQVQVKRVLDRSRK